MRCSQGLLNTSTTNQQQYIIQFFHDRNIKPHLKSEGTILIFLPIVFSCSFCRCQSEGEQHWSCFYIVSVLFTKQVDKIRFFKVWYSY